MFGGCWNGLGTGGWGRWAGMGLFGSIFGFVLLAGLLVLIVLAVVWAVRQSARTPRAASGPEDPFDLVRRRLAAGEITVAEYEEIRDRLRS